MGAKMQSQRHGKIARLWYQSLLVIDAVCGFLFGLCLLSDFGWVDNEWAGAVAMVAILGGMSWFLLFYSAHFILTCVILVRGPMLLRKRVALWYFFPVIAIYGLSQCTPTIYMVYLLPGIALFAMIAWPVRWLSIMNRQSA
jgi:hypothetical protein